jgi:uncharacterized protein YukE
MARMGMDVEAVENASRELQRRSQDIDQLIASIESVVHGLTSIWDGQDARTFVNDWWPQHKKALMSASQSIAGLGKSAYNNAQDQRGASKG